MSRRIATRRVTILSKPSQSVALPSEVGGGPVRTRVSGPVVMTVMTMVPAHVTTHVSAWIGRGAGPLASGVSLISRLESNQEKEYD
jgi:hypothetical protein